MSGSAGHPLALTLRGPGKERKRLLDLRLRGNWRWLHPQFLSVSCCLKGREKKDEEWRKRREEGKQEEWKKEQSCSIERKQGTILRKQSSSKEEMLQINGLCIIYKKKKKCTQRGTADRGEWKPKLLHKK